MILIISHEKDGHYQAVRKELEGENYPYRLLDLSCFPSAAQLTMSFLPNAYNDTVLHHSGNELHLSEVGAVWWRRPQQFTLHADLKGSVEANFTHGECHCAVHGMWLLPHAGWINHPVNDEVASRKVYQLKVATEAGLIIPKTCVTSNPDHARAFIESLGIGEVIYKSFSASEQAWRETRLLKEEELDKLINVQYAPVIFQECIHADLDLRITVIGDQIFPAAIYSQDTAYKVDYRMNYHVAKIVHHPLPDNINKQLLQLMRSLGLVYGAIDMRKRHNGEYVFLEVNPAGQWLFMENPTGMPITKTLAHQLMEFDQQYQQAAPAKMPAREPEPAVIV